MAVNHPFDVPEENRGARREFISYYQEEMQRNISEIRKTISDVRKESDAKQLLQKIMDAGNSMSDLAMVYGFESEEAVGRKITSIIKTHNPENDLEVILTQIEESTKLAEEAMIRITQPEKEHMDDGSDNKSAENLLDARVKEYFDEEKAESLIFDIREDEKLISYLEDLEDANDVAYVRESALDAENNASDDNDGAATLLLSEQNDHELGFDIPIQEDASSGIGSSFSELKLDVTEIDFRETSSERDDERKNLFKKITGFFGFGGKSEL